MGSKRDATDFKKCMVMGDRKAMSVDLSHRLYEKEGQPKRSPKVTPKCLVRLQYRS